MVAAVRLLMPTHLFPIRHPEPRVVVALDPVFFEGPDGTFRVHKGKIAYMVAAAEEYARERVAEVCYPQDVPSLYRSLSRETAVAAYPAMDRFVERKLARIPGLVVERHPGFVLDPWSYAGAARLVPVYKAAREAAGILVGAASMDEANRHPPDPALSRDADPPIKRLGRAARRGAAFAEREYPGHFGDARACGYYPVTRRAALARLRRYARRGLPLMRYQDAIVEGRSFLAHSALSAAVNAGLIGPAEVCTEAARARGASPSDVEGFVRQVLGWRELVAVVYARRTPEMEAAFSRFPRPADAWYLGTTGLDPVDDAAKRAGETAYLHHIERLMVALNALVLTGHEAGAAYRWFMEAVAIDAYDWVMIGNLAAMGYARETGSRAARKPYISSSAYIAKMSSGYAGGGWRDRWDALFYGHVRAEGVPYFRRVLEGARYRGSEGKWTAAYDELADIRAR